VDAKLALSLGLKNVGVVEEQNAFGQGVCRVLSCEEKSM
jgi:hypothetical protein